MVPIGAGALVPIAACGRVRVRICLRDTSARLVPELWMLIGVCGRVRVRICLRSPGARLVAEPWCLLVPEP